jgi:phosphoenolpyruvate carboxylase
MFFKNSLLENSMMSMVKSFSAHRLQNDPEFGEFWQIIYDEFLENKATLLKIIAGHKELMEITLMV